MFHACVQRFDVTGGRGNILGSERPLTYQEFIEKRHVRTAACIPDAHGVIPLQTCIRRTRIIDVKSACCSLRIKDRPRQCCSRTWRLARILAPRSDCGFGSNSRC
jgi:hypothetical protein